MSRRPPPAVEPPRLLQALRVGVGVTSIVVFVLPLAAWTGVAAAALGGAAGLLAGPRLARGPLRTPAALLGLLLLGLLGPAGSWLSTAPATAPWLLGGPGALLAADLLRWSLPCFAASAAVGLLSTRTPGLVVLEPALVVALCATALSAHRDGAFHRPLLLGDWAWSRGVDPARLLLALGAAAALASLPLLLRPQARRAGRVLGVLGALAVAMLLLYELLGLPTPAKSEDPLGLTGAPDEGRGRQPDEGERGGGRPARPGEGDQARNTRRRGGGRSEGGGGSSPDQLRFEDQPPPPNQGQAAVAVVVFHDDYRPAGGLYYFRQVAMSQYNGRRMVQATVEGADLDLPLGFPAEAPVTPQAPPLSPELRQTVETSVSLLVQHPQPLALVSATRLRSQPNPDPMRFVRAYRVRSEVLTVGEEELLVLGAAPPAWPEALLEHYTRSPDDPRYAALAEQIVASLDDRYRELPMARGIAVQAWLGEHVIYSRRSRHASAEDPTASFLFGDRRGYCVHIAHAAVYLLRALGLPARVAAGYAVDPAHREGGSNLLIRSGNAHAWPELYLEGVGWVAVDPQPRQTEEPSLQPPDPLLQRMMGEMARGESTDGGGERRQRRPWRLRALLPWLWAALRWLLLLALPALYAIKAWRRWSPWFPGGDRARVRRAYRSASDRLAELGERRRFGEPRPLFARRAASLCPSYVALTSRCVAASLSAQPAVSADLLTLLGAQRAELCRTFPRWRRWSGALDPTSWMRTR